MLINLIRNLCVSSLKLLKSGLYLQYFSNCINIHKMDTVFEIYAFV